jgi:hypothetical protein
MSGKHPHPIRKVSEYEQHAADCRRLAAETSNQTKKKKLLDMAEEWSRLAEGRRVQLTGRPDSDTPTGSSNPVGS